MSDSYNLLYNPWIPLVNREGQTEEAGLRDALLKAHNYREIRDPMPTVEFGLYRLLTALALDIYQLDSLDELAGLLDAGAFDSRKADEYFARHKDRFDLFHSRYPFLQTAGLDGEDKPLSGLLPAMPSGTNVIHFHHAFEEEFAVCPAAAARQLTSIAPFMTAGGAGLSPSVNGAPPLYVLIVGPTLFETICLNICALPLLPEPSGDAPPAWRNERAPGGERRREWSYLEALTWRPRRIKLIPGDNGCCSLTHAPSDITVRAMKFEPGDSCDFAWRDPSVPYRITERGVFGLRPPDDRDLWRDTGPIALLREADYRSEQTNISFQRPALVTQFAMLLQEELADCLKPSKPLNLRLYGMRTDGKMKVFEWQREELCIPGMILRSPFAADAQRAMDLADAVAYRLTRAIKMTYPREGKSNKSALDRLIGEAQQGFWAELRPRYDALLDTLALNDAQSAVDAMNTWKEHLKKLGQAALDVAIGQMDADAEMLQRQTLAVRHFRLALFSLFEPPEKKRERLQ